ncbi:MAG: response regulator [Prevotellaceae bacterium]|nr:response regulator [Prevotellaceae bacterium]
MFVDSLFRTVKVREADARQDFSSKRVSAIHQDAEGYVWIGTELGLYRYDGFQTKCLRNDREKPDLLTSNKITSLADRGDYLWIGTAEGLNRMDLRTGECRQYHLIDFPNSDNVGELLVTRGGRDLWVGTEGGLYRLDEAADTFCLMCDVMGNAKVPHCAIKSLTEDAEGYVWIGTWDKGLFRYDQKKGEFYEMPRFNDLNSAQTVVEDSRGRLWVGTWGKGLYRIDNPHATGEPLSFANYQTGNTEGRLPSDWIYSVVTVDRKSGTLCVGTSKGIALYAAQAGADGFRTLTERETTKSGLFSHGASPLLCDKEGNIWVSTMPTGMTVVSERKKKFTWHALPREVAEEDMINSLSLDREGDVWVSLERGGFLRYERETGSVEGFGDVKALKGRSVPPKVFSLYETSDGRMLLGTTKDGIIALSRDRLYRTEVNQGNCPWLPDNCVFCFLELEGGDLLAGTWKGLCVWHTDGSGEYLDTDSLAILRDAQVRHITLDHEERLWLSTKNKGIICLTGTPDKPKTLRAKGYTSLRGTELKMTDIHKTVADAAGRVWACSRETGLLLYDPESDTFESVSQRYGLPDDDICGMEEGKKGNLWLSSPRDIMCLSLNTDGSLRSLRYFPIDEEVEKERGSLFAVEASASDGRGRMCFAAEGGFITLTDPLDELRAADGVRAGITDIRVFNTPLERLSERERAGISDTLPPYTRSIRLTQKQNDLTIFFSRFSYEGQRLCRFAYKMEGYDRDWIYPEAGVNSSYYCNLPAGRYTFRLMAAGADGEWAEMETPLRVRIMPPLWLRWWALAAYAVVALTVALFLFLYMRAKEEHRRSMHLARLEKEKTEELNHKKMQFFTNITHDLMTPLTVISAAVSELETESPGHRETCKTIMNNLNKQMRLLQQILAFRKAETGNLRLRVSRGDLVDFCRKEVESIRPLMRKKRLSLSLSCQTESMEAYFDPDAMDKIVYNLLSNAAKYTQEDGRVEVTLSRQIPEEANGKVMAELTVRDNGAGIPEKRQAELFKRFYEGEHRRSGVYGTGIGLSLTKDLVTLHHGTIEVRSKEGEGTAFIVKLPIGRESYSEEEMDTQEPMVCDMEEETSQSGEQEPGEKPRETERAEKRHTLLIVEDDEELREMMRRMLGRTYDTLTAENGKEALEAMERGRVDLVVADVMMPLMDGMEMVRRMRSEEKGGNCPVIMLTAMRDEESRARIYEAGADAYITKPFHMTVLQARVENLLRRSEKVNEEIREKLAALFGELNVSSDEEEFLQRCVAVVSKHLSDVDFDQQQFADEAGASPSSLYKKLKTLTGLNTSAFIRNVRMNAARDILEKNPAVRISDLAYAVGYSDPKYFSACFKKRYGVLPSEYKGTRGGNHEEFPF